MDIDPITEEILIQEGMFDHSVVKSVKSQIKQTTDEARKKEAGSCDNLKDQVERRICLLKGMIRLLKKRDTIIKQGIKRCNDDYNCLNQLRSLGMENSRSIRMNGEEIDKLKKQLKRG